MQAALGITGCVIFASMVIFFPETSHPGARGIDKLQREQACTGVAPRRMVFVNPFKPLLLLRSPNLVGVVRSRN